MAVSSVNLTQHESRVDALTPVDDLPTALQYGVLDYVSAAGSLWAFSRLSAPSRELACAFAGGVLARHSTMVTSAVRRGLVPELGEGEQKVYDAAARLLIDVTQYEDSRPRGRFAPWHPSLDSARLFRWEERELEADPTLSVEHVRHFSLALEARDKHLQDRSPLVVLTRELHTYARETREARILACQFAGRVVTGHATRVLKTVSKKKVPSVQSRDRFLFEACAHLLKSVTKCQPRLQKGLLAWEEREAALRLGWERTDDGLDALGIPLGAENEVEAHRVIHLEEVRDLSRRLLKAQDSKVTELDLRGENVFSLPSGFGALTALRHLNLFGNDLRGIRDLRLFSNLKELTELHLGESLFSSLAGASALQRLEVLDIHDTRVSDLSPLESSEHLSDLNINDTNVSDNSANKEVLLKLPLKRLWVPEFFDLPDGLPHGVVQNPSR
jgi:hypothetical protein